MPCDSATTPQRIAPESVDAAKHEADAGGQRNERIHVGREMAQLLNGIDKEFAAAIHEIGQCQQQGHLVGHIAAAKRQPMHGNRHDREGKEPRKQRAPTQQRVGALLDFGHTAVGLDYQVVADVVHGLLHFLQRNGGGVIVDERRTSRQRHRSRADASQGVELFLNVGRASRAGHAHHRNSFLHVRLL